MIKKFATDLFLGASMIDIVLFILFVQAVLMTLFILFFALSSRPLDSMLYDVPKGFISPLQRAFSLFLLLNVLSVIALFNLTRIYPL